QRENLAAVRDQIELIEGDLRDLKTVRQAVEGCGCIFHVGALPSVPRSVAEPMLSHEINVTGTLNVLLAARDAGGVRVVFSSSSSVYGDTPTLPKHERLIPQPRSPYAVHKLTGEQYCRVFTELFGVPTISLRYFNVFGPRQDPQSQYAAVIPRFITRMLADERPVIFGDGYQTRDFSYVENVVRANLAASTAPANAFGRVVNIACGGRTSLRELVATINDILGKRIEPVFEPPRAGDVRDSQADVSEAAALLGWKPTVDFAEGIRRTIEWYRRNRTP
ncbi:MAG: NAD-dependent epimerase/dehydratase family protein, partial [Verrucomicrobiae bacterium]|nr:NAD-dependent epimerase/dehydratase family protein [Verrucomicrobiae bacterium]